MRAEQVVRQERTANRNLSWCLKPRLFFYVRNAQARREQLTVGVGVGEQMGMMQMGQMHPQMYPGMSANPALAHRPCCFAERLLRFGRIRVVLCVN